MSATRHLGKGLWRPDAADKASGKALYIHDLTRPGMLHGKIKWSAHASARILRIDTRKAERVPGVRAVLTGASTPELRFGFLRDNLALKRDRVRSLRDEVAAVAATDVDAAAEAIDLIAVEYEPLPAVFDAEEALREGAPLVHEKDGRGQPLASNLLPLTFRHDSGDMAAARRASAFIVEGRYRTPRIQQSCMGTAGCIAELDASGNLTMWAKTQIPFLAQRDFTRALASIGAPGHARVIVPALGGGFGTGLDTHAYEYIAILLARATGRPVRILYDREGEFASLSPRQCADVTIEAGCDGERRLTFRHVDVLQDNGAYASWGATYPSVMMLPATSLYRVAAVHFDTRIVYTNNTYCQAMRGYGNPEMTFPLESSLDELAEKAGMDPLDIRRINCNEPGEVTPMGLRVATCGLRECLEKAAAGIGWVGRGLVPRRSSTGKRRGMGIASLMHVGGSGRIYRSDGSGIVLRLDDFGTVQVHAGGVEMGQGHHAAIALGVAEALGVRPESVAIHPTDTATCPWDVGTHASRGAFTALKAIELAAEKLRARLFELAEEVLRAEGQEGARRDRLDLEDGILSLRDESGAPRATMDLDRLVRAIHFRSGGEVLSAEGFYEPPTELPDWARGVGNLSACYAYGAQGFEVEVDEETGDVRILKAVLAHDVGKVLHPQALAGQCYGALAQGIGYALYEEVKTREGRIENPSFRDYKIPTAHEMGFPIELAFVETDDPAGPYGAKGVGEPGLVPTAPAIANAIYDAIGIRFRDLPVTPEKIVAALRARGERG